MEPQPFEFRRRLRAPSKRIRTQLRVSETNGQGNSPEFRRASVGHIRATAFPQP